MIKQMLARREKILRGAYRTWIRGHDRSYESSTWWDEKRFVDGLSDRQTVSPRTHPVTVAYHYASMEVLILRHLRNADFDLEGARVCDIGPGAGHWIDFYLGLGASAVTAVDISRRVVDHLDGRYDGRVTIRQGRVLEVEGPCDVVNAIGVMFHMVEDDEWRSAVQHVGGMLRPGGVFVVGGHFGWLNNINVQFDKQNAVNKRLRSAANWRRVLKRAGFASVRIYRNLAYLRVPESMPENNVLIATAASPDRFRR